MKKVGLITIVAYNNYGNKLQNYAVQKTLESIGCNVTTIVNTHKETNNKINILEKIKQIDINFVKSKFVRTINKRKYQEAFNQKNKRFKNFTKKYIKESNFIITAESIPDFLSKDFDFFVVGSDQVWNPTYRKGSPIDFLTFAPGNKRIAYSPSFGVSEIPIEYQKDYKKWLTEFKSLSVREDAGSKIIKTLTNRESLVLIDPTLMLNQQDWLNISHESELKPTKNFVLTYFLGDISKEIKELIKSISLDKGYEVVNLGSYKDIKRYATDPGEFIDYINSASIFITDSFHGAVFSIILKKPFIICDRLGKDPKMNSRINTLLSKFQLENRKWEEVQKTKKYFDINFSHVQPILEVERTKAFNYLKEALENDCED